MDNTGIKKYNLPESPYYSDGFRMLWEKMLEKYSFKDSENERTVRNYGSCVKLICDHSGKDFLELTTDDAISFFEMIDKKAEKGELRPSTVFTYKKNLRSVGNYIERMNSSTGKRYVSPFNGFVFDAFANKKRDNIKKSSDRDAMRDEATAVLNSIKNTEQEQYYYIFCLLAYFKDLTPVKICEMKREQLKLTEKSAVFVFEINRQRPKTNLPGREFSPLQAEVRTVEYRFSIELEKAFCSFYPDYIKRVSEKNGNEAEYVFYNRNFRPVNFKTLGSIMKKHIELNRTKEIRHIRDICGALS